MLRVMKTATAAMAVATAGVAVLLAWEGAAGGPGRSAAAGAESVAYTGSSFPVGLAALLVVAAGLTVWLAARGRS